jgi:hypothetical protein
MSRTGAGDSIELAVLIMQVLLLSSVVVVMGFYLHDRYGRRVPAVRPRTEYYEFTSDIQLSEGLAPARVRNDGRVRGGM